MTTATAFTHRMHTRVNTKIHQSSPAVAIPPPLERTTISLEIPVIQVEDKSTSLLEVEVKRSVTLMLFIVDTSMPGGEKRISAVKGSISCLLPKKRVAIISCGYDEAQVTLQPTSSFITANRKMMKMKPSILGNLGAGLTLALASCEEALATGYVDHVVMVIIGR